MTEEEKQKRLAAARKILSEELSRPSQKPKDTSKEESSEYLKARERAVRFIGSDFSKSSGKVKNVLQREGYSTELISTVVDDLMEAEYLNDVKAARRVIRRHSGTKTKSRVMIKSLLREQGISPKAVQEVLEEVPSDEVLLMQVLETMDVEFFSEASKERDRFYRRMVNRGFSEHVLRRCVQELLRKA